MSNTTRKTSYLVRLAIMVAITLVLAYTPLGYFKTAGLEISFMMVPVTVGAVLLGPAAGAILGGLFGLTSFIQCLTGSLFGAALLSINPIFTLITCVIPRILAGWLPGLLFKVWNERLEKKDGLVPCAVCCLAGPVLNTLFFMSALCLFFFQTDYIQGMAGGLNVFAFVVAFVGVQGAVEALVCFVLGTAIGKALLRLIRK